MPYSLQLTVTAENINMLHTVSNIAINKLLPSFQDHPLLPYGIVDRERMSQLQLIISRILK